MDNLFKVGKIIISENDRNLLYDFVIDVLQYKFIFLTMI